MGVRYTLGDVSIVDVFGYGDVELMMMTGSADHILNSW